ncbi:hypothetical protein ACVWWF_005999 [Pseudomonas tolaasii]
MSIKKITILKPFCGIMNSSGLVSSRLDHEDRFSQFSDAKLYNSATVRRVIEKPSRFGGDYE